MINPLDERAKFDHHFRRGGEAKRVTILNNSGNIEEYACKENHESLGIAIFRFRQPINLLFPFLVSPPFQLAQGDVIEEENGNQWRVENYKVRWNILPVIPTGMTRPPIGIPRAPISFDVTTRPLYNSNLTNETREQEETHASEPSESVTPSSPTTPSAPIIQPQTQLENLPEIKQEPEEIMPEEPPENRELNIIELLKKIIQFATDHTRETIIILALVLGVSVVWLFLKDSIPQIIPPTEETNNNPQQESKLRVRIRLEWNDGEVMKGGYVTLLSHGGPKPLGRSNDQGYIPSIELPKQNGIKFEVSHPIHLKIAVDRELNLEAPPETPIEWTFPKDSDSLNNSSPSDTITSQESSSSNIIKVNMVCSWKGDVPVNYVMRGAALYGFDRNDEPFSIDPTDERGFTTFFMDKDSFPLKLKTDHPKARDAQHITISLRESELTDDNIFPFKDCKFYSK